MDYKHSQDLPEGLIQHFKAGYRIHPITGCWEWVRGTSEGGYGRFWKGSKYIYSEYAHRFAYFLEKGSLDSEQLVCHTCDNPKCVNPQHLFQGTSKDNSLDASKKGRLSTWKRPRKEAHGRSKLTQVQVDEIKASSLPRKELAQNYGVSLSRISKIKQGVTWV